MNSPFHQPSRDDLPTPRKCQGPGCSLSLLTRQIPVFKTKLQFMWNFQNKSTLDALLQSLAIQEKRVSAHRLVNVSTSSSGIKKPQYVAFAPFCGVNNPSVTVSSYHREATPCWAVKSTLSKASGSCQLHHITGSGPTVHQSVSTNYIEEKQNL
jgi:hypothetical protein